MHDRRQPTLRIYHAYDATAGHFYIYRQYQRHRNLLLSKGEGHRGQGRLPPPREDRRMSVTEWLRDLGLQQYTAAFRDNEIDERVLPSLTADDLKELGVTLIGHRRLLLDAISALREIGPRPTASDLAAAPSQPPASSAEAERRQLTVMFCDIVGSTALSTQFDPEDLRELIGGYHRAVADAVVRFDGFVAKYMGDGVLVYFGYPRAHEDDAERAVRAGLATIDAVSKLQGPVPLRVRIGIATGLAVVGDLTGTGAAQERGVVGETPNLAARMQGLAEPNAVVIADATHRQLGRLFDLRDLGSTALAGFAEPQHAWRVLGESAVASRFEALRSEKTPLVGRAEEFDTLSRRWEQAKTGDGRVVLLSGEAGIGKSRLTAALFEHIGAEPHTRIRQFCSPQRADSALHPFVSQLEHAAGLAYTDTPRAKLDKLDTVLAQTATSAEDAALIADMLSLPNDGRYPVLDMAPEQRRQRVLQALLSQVAGLARQGPVLMVFEDAHWADPTSLEMLGRAMDRIRTLPVLFVVTFRPEFAAPWVGQSHVTSLSLNRLAERDTAAIIARLAGNQHLPADVLAEIVERTDGIPLFVEEMTKAVLEAGSEGAARRTVTGVPSPVLGVPATLHASLLARLDRLGPAAREVAQIGAAIGREFPHALLASVASKPEPELAAALDALVQAGLLFRHGVPPHASYLFKHALVEDAAYSTLLRERRRALHARIVEALESQSAETAESRPEILAHHYTEAGLIERAAGWWGKAGLRSLDRSALVEAVTQLTRALDQIATLPSTPALRREQIKLQVAIIAPLYHIKGYAAAEPNAAAERAQSLIAQAEALGEPPEDPLLLFQVLHSFTAANHVAFNGEVARKYDAKFMMRAERQKAIVPLMIGHRIMGVGLVHEGDFSESRVHFDKALALYEPALHRPLARRFGQDHKVACLSYQSSPVWMLGYPEVALRGADEAVRNAREIGEAATLMFALSHTGIPYTLGGNYALVAAHSQELGDLADEKGSLFWKAIAMMRQGSVLALAGRAADAIEKLTAGITALRATGATFWTPFHLAHLARAHAELGQYELAWHCVGDVMAAMETSQEKWCESEVHRTAGEIALMGPQSDASKAEAHFDRAIAIAHKQQARSWELRATTSLAHLWRNQGRRREAHDRLSPIYNWFTEGFDTVDLKSAGSLLGELI
jgi:class 3 adenylate cyclase/predicted ATPase